MYVYIPEAYLACTAIVAGAMAFSTFVTIILEASEKA